MTQSIKLSTDQMRMMSLFQNVTGATARDCIEDENNLITCSRNNPNNIIIADLCGVCGENCLLDIATTAFPVKYSISNIYPNPFNPVSNITYGIPEYTNVQISVYDMSGKQIATLINESQSPSYHSINWNAYNHPSGIYFVQMVSNGFVQTQKVVLMK